MNPKKDVSVFGQRLRNLRRRKCWSQKELTEHSGISKNIIALYESGKVSGKPRDKTLEQLAQALEISKDVLYCSQSKEFLIERISALLPYLTEEKLNTIFNIIEV